MALHRTFPWNKRYVYSFGDLVIHLSKSRNVTLMGRLLLKQYIKDEVPSKMEYFRYEREDRWRTNIYSYDIKLEAFDHPQFHRALRTKESRHYRFTSTYRKSERLLNMVTIVCAACGKDTGWTAADRSFLYNLFSDEYYFCGKCEHKLSHKVLDAALGSFSTDSYEGRELRKNYKEILILAKQLSPRSVIPSAFK